MSGTRIIRLSGRTIESGIQLSARIADGLGLTAQSDQYTPREFERSLGAKIKAHAEPTVVIADDCETWSLDLDATLSRSRAKSDRRLRAVVTIDFDCEFVAHLESSLAEDKRFHMVDIPLFEHEDVAAYVALIVVLRDKRSDEAGTDAELSMPEAGSMANQNPLVHRPRSVIQPLDSSSRDSSSSTTPSPAPKKLPEQRGAAPGASDVYDPFR